MPLPTEESDLISEIARIRKENLSGMQVIVEKVGGYVGKGQPGSSMFKFGRGVGVIIGALIAYRIPFREVTPQEWQKAAGTGTANGRNPAQWKRHLRELARQRYPQLQPTLSTSDALLMLAFFEK